MLDTRNLVATAGEIRETCISNRQQGVWPSRTDLGQTPANNMILLQLEPATFCIPFRIQPSMLLPKFVGGSQLANVQKHKQHMSTEFLYGAGNGRITSPTFNYGTIHATF
jgi:hypothetical protein